MFDDIQTSMGNRNNSEEKLEESILCNPKKGEASELYWACRSGNLDEVRRIVSSIPFAEINRLESNGSTALHAACYFGHADIVEFLLHQKCVLRHRCNRFGNTAYEEATTNKIRELFHRAESSQRFSTSDETKKILVIPSEELSESVNEIALIEDTGMIPKDWVVGSKTDGDICLEGFLKYILAVGMTWNANRKFIKFVCRLITGTDMYCIFSQLLQWFIDTKMTQNDPHYNEASLLVQKYRTTKNVEHLLRLYTIECPFYKSLGCGEETTILYMPIIWKLHTLQHRAFKGRSYRGLKMTQNDFRAYQWAEQNPERSITLQSFCSTSVVENVALLFAGVRNKEMEKSDRMRTLMVMDFRTNCPTAIRLYATLEDSICISEHENEHEVLVLPGTIFRVTSIDKIDSLYIIYLESTLAQYDQNFIAKVITRDNMTQELNELFQKILSTIESDE